MFQSLEIFQIASAMAKSAGKRQALISQNVANSDTPEYIARDLPSFHEIYQQDLTTVQRATRAAHLNGVADGLLTGESFEDKSHASINGNTVSVEKEMLKGVETKRQHDRALSIYKSSLDVLRMTLGK